MKKTTFALLVSLATVPGCSLLDGESLRPLQGIWLGAFQDTSISLELRADGRAILVLGGEDEIGLAAHTLDLQQRPAHLDIRFDKKDWGVFRMIVERVGPDGIRIEGLDDRAPRPREFTEDAVLLRRSDRHTFPREVQSAEGLTEALGEALKGDIWFGGDRGRDMLAICDALFRFQFRHNTPKGDHAGWNYFLTVAAARRDPPQELLNRFTSHVPPVKPGSEFCRGSGDAFRIESIEWLDRDTVKAVGQHYRGPEWASGSTYRLRRKGRGWEVVAHKRDWVS